MHTNKNRPLRLIQITDPHLFADRQQQLLGVNTDTSLRAVLQHIENQNSAPDLLLATGDISQDGQPESYQRFLELAQNIDAPLAGLPGNHDKPDVLVATWGKARTQAIHDFAHWRLVLLDTTVAGSNGGHLAKDQLHLLEQAVHSADDRFVLVALHHNPVPSGSPWLDTMRIDNAADLFDTLQALPQVKALVWGHIHQEFDAIHQFAGPAEHALRLLATPATCIQFQPHSTQFALDSADPGYRLLDLHDDGSIDTKVVRVSGLGLQPDTASNGY